MRPIRSLSFLLMLSCAPVGGAADDDGSGSAPCEVGPCERANVCVRTSAQSARFCGVDCSDGRPCGDGAECEAVENADGLVYAWQCVPVDRTCEPEEIGSPYCAPCEDDDACNSGGDTDADSDADADADGDADEDLFAPGNACLQAADADGNPLGSPFCGVDCAAGLACPSGFSCVPVGDGSGGDGGRMCAPADGDCAGESAPPPLCGTCQSDEECRVP